MQPRDATRMLVDSEVGVLGPTVWADLGCGSGVFTLALAGLLAAGSSIHAVDRDSVALLGLPATHDGVRITTHVADMTMSRVVPDLDGIIMANSMHYVMRKTIHHPMRRRGSRPRSVLIVEYYTTNPVVDTLSSSRHGCRDLRPLQASDHPPCEASRRSITAGAALCGVGLTPEPDGHSQK